MQHNNETHWYLQQLKQELDKDLEPHKVFDKFQEKHFLQTLLSWWDC